MKVKSADLVKKFTDIPNIGKEMEKDFLFLGLKVPADLKKQTGIGLYKKLCDKTGYRHDPCVLDTFLAAVDFMNGASPRPWWNYTAERKRKYKV